MLKVLGYYVVFTPVSIFGGVALVNIGWNEYLVLAISMVVNFVTEYIFDSLVVFRNSIGTNDIAKKQAQVEGQNNSNEGAVDEQAEQHMDEWHCVRKYCCSWHNNRKLTQNK